MCEAALFLGLLFLGYAYGENKRAKNHDSERYPTEGELMGIE